MLQLPKPLHLELVLCNKRSYSNEKPAHPNEEKPLLAATRENLHTATKTQQSQKERKKERKRKTFSHTPPIPEDICYKASGWSQRGRVTN